MNIKRLEERILKLRGAPLILLCKLPDGRQERMTVKECVKENGQFIRVVSGNNLRDLDELISYEYGDIPK